MSIFVLKDTQYDESVSKTHNFTMQWSKFYPYAKTAFYSLPFKDDDIIIVNLYHGNPYGKYQIPKECKKIFITHRINNDTVLYLKDADYIIYLNDIQKEVVEKIEGIIKPNYVCPRHPMHEFNSVVNQEDWVYIGGWFTEDKISNLYDKLLSLHKKLPLDIGFKIYPIWGKNSTFKKRINEFEKEIKDKSSNFGTRKIIICNEELFYDMMVLKSRICKYAFLWDNSPDIEEIKKLISDKDDTVLNYSIEESSMLALFQSSNKKQLIVENRIKYLPYFEKREKFTFKDFSNVIKKTVEKMKIN